MDEDRFKIPGDWVPDYSKIFPLSEDLPASAWHVTDKMKELHNRGVDGSNVTVAVCDTAGQTDHPFLPKQIAGKDFTGSRVGLKDGHGHGTHVHGIVISVAPKAKLVTAKVLGDSGSGSTTGINAGRVWASEQGADVISESLGDGGGPPLSDDLDAYDKAYSNGTSICCAALGNAGNGSNTVGRPGSYTKHNHGIAALQRDWKTIANFSSAGPAARYAAPGQNIISCKPGGGWVDMSGTSMATPWEAGLYALIISWRRGLGLADITGPEAWAKFFQDNNLTIDLGAPGWDPRYGNGLVDVVKVFDFLLDKTSI